MSFSFPRFYTFLLFFIITASSLIFVGCSSAQRFSSDESFDKEITTSAIRILLNEPSDKFSFRADEDLILQADGNEIMIRRGDLLRFSSENGLILYSGKSNGRGKDFLVKPKASFFSFNDKKISGNIKIVTNENLIYLVNTISIEDYLKGVIPSEMPLGKGNEYFQGLKAFAICARTYALQRMLSSKNLFDVRMDVRDQVYGGEGKRKVISDRAVEETRGMILTYENMPATVFYSSTCGGYTEDAENVFKVSGAPYLSSIKDGNDPFCSVSPQIKWEEIYSAERIIALLKKSNKIRHTDYRLEDININSRFESGRINELEIVLNNRNEGKITIKLLGNNIRFVLLDRNDKTLKSNNFEIIENGDSFIFKGKGYGHGVGLCQWGTLSQSAKGITFEKILNHYFPGTEITRNYGKD